MQSNRALFILAFLYFGPFLFIGSLVCPGEAQSQWGEEPEFLGQGLERPSVDKLGQVSATGVSAERVPGRESWEIRPGQPGRWVWAREVGMSL